MAKGDIAAERLEGGSHTASLSVPHAREQRTSGPQGLTIYDVMLVGIVFIWAANASAIKWTLDYIEPLAFNAIRFSLATLVPVGILLLGKENFRWQRGDGWKILLLGLVGHGLYQALFILASDYTFAGNVVLILSVNPAFVVIFGSLLGIERARVHAWVGTAITLVGVLLVVLGSGQELELGTQLLGDLLMVVVTALWAMYTLFSQFLLKRYSPIKLNALTMPIGSFFLLAVAAPEIASTATAWPMVPPMAWLLLVLSGLLSVSVAYIVWNKGVQQLGSTRTSVYANLVPVLGALISFFVLREPLGLFFWAGMALVLAGVSLSRFGGRLRRNNGK